MKLQFVLIYYNSPWCSSFLTKSGAVISLLSDRSAGLTATHSLTSNKWNINLPLIAFFKKSPSGYNNRPQLIIQTCPPKMQS